MWTPPRREFPEDVDAVRDADPRVSCDPPNLEETRKAVKELECGKVPGECGILSEMLKAGRAAPSFGCTLLCSIWKTWIIPTDWRRGVVVPISKGYVDTN